MTRRLFSRSPRSLFAVHGDQNGLAIATVLASALAATACDRPPSADSLPQWTQSDHHSTDDGRQAAAGGGAMGGMGGQVPQAPQSADSKRGEVDQLVDLTWRSQCVTCHGPMGRGDGQMGPMVQAPDLTQADWQSKVTDTQMATIIKGGRNRMPAFNLPDSVLAGLVARIRALAAH